MTRPHRNTETRECFIQCFIKLFHFFLISSVQPGTTEYGKGLADGVGGLIKRTCNKIVRQNIQDISNFTQFSICIKEEKTKSVHTWPPIVTGLISYTW